MSELPTQVLVWLNVVSDTLGRWLLAPIGIMPGWLSATVIAALTGVLMLLAFKYTSNQRAIKRVRDDISANLLTLKLFKDSALVALRAQAALLSGAARLFVLALVPMAVMALPACLLLAQLGQWYQYRPLKVGDTAVVVVALKGGTDGRQHDVSLQLDDAARIVTGPVHVQSKNWVCWDVEASKAGVHHAVFEVDGTRVEKELVIGEGYAPVSPLRPNWSWRKALEYPREPPFPPDSAVQAISIDYPERFTWKIFGVEPWIVYWFVVSMVAALCVRPLLRVNG